VNKSVPTAHDWLGLREAIELVGPLIFPGVWTGTERHAPTVREANAQLRAIFDLTPAQLAREHATGRAKIEAEAKRDRAARKATGLKPSDDVREALEKLRSQLASETHPRRRGALEKVMRNLAPPSKASQPQPSRREIARQRAEFTSDLLAEQVATSYRPGLSARMRWLDTHATIRHEACAGRLRVKLQQPGLDPFYPLIGELPRIFPPPGETCASIHGFPADVLLARADLESVFTGAEEKEAGSPARPTPRGPGRPGMGSEIDKEMERRAGEGQLGKTMTEEAQYLAKWATSNSGDKKAPKENSIRKEHARRYRELKARAS